MIPKLLIGGFVVAGLGAGVYLVSGSVATERSAMLAGALPAATSAIASPASEKELAVVPPEEYATVLTEEGRTVVDVRTPEEFAEGHLPGATNIDFRAADFRDRVAALSKDASYAIYCRSGNRSGQALSIMDELGFTDVIDLKGGVQAWFASGKELCTDC